MKAPVGVLGKILCLEYEHLNFVYTNVEIGTTTTISTANVSQPRLTNLTHP